MPDSRSSPAEANRILEGTVSVWEILAYVQADCWLTKSGAAAHITHKDDRVIEQAIRGGKLRAYRIGKKILIRKSDIDAWVMAGEITRENRKADRTDLQRLVDAAIKKAKGAA